MKKVLEHKICSKKIVVFLVLTLLIFSCSDDNGNTGPDSSEINISLVENSGKPGEVVNFTTDSEITSLEDYVVYVEDESSIIMKNINNNQYYFSVPVLESGNATVYLENIQNGNQSNYVTFSVESLPDTGLPPGEVATECFELQKETTQILKEEVVPNLHTTEVINDNNLQLMNNELDKVINYFDLLEQEINSLSEEDKELYDQILYSSGVYNLFQRSNKQIKNIAESKSMYSSHYVLASLDGFSSVISFTNRMLVLGGAIATVASGGTLGPVFVLGVTAVSTIDNGIDAVIPTDLDELSVDHYGDVSVPKGGSTQIRIEGRFVCQSNPVDFAISTFVGALCNLSTFTNNESLENLYDLITTTFVDIGIDVNDNFSDLTENWQNITYVDHRIDPAYYDSGFSAFLTIFGEYVGISVSGGSLEEFLENISGLNYHIEDENIATFDPENSSIVGIEVGQSELIYDGYRFKPLEGWAGIIGGIIGLEYPQDLDDEQIENFEFNVQEFDETYIDITSTPDGATVYLDGTNMNKTTPAVLDNVEPGNHHIRLYKFGYNEYNTNITLQENTPQFINADLGAPLPPLPVFTIDNPQDNQTFYDNVITVNGSLQLEDVNGNTAPFNGNNAILTLNGVDQEITVADGNFNETVSISSGDNTLQMRANSENGDTGFSDELTVYGDFTGAEIEVVLTWNTPTSDLDLHIWNPNGEHCYYSNMNISDGSLDIDDVEGYGPETFTVENALNGTYVVQINSYFLDNDDYADATVQVILNGSTDTYGPHHFVVDDGNGNDPDAWWEVTTFTMSKQGNKIDIQPISKKMSEKIIADMKNLPEKK